MNTVAFARRSVDVAKRPAELLCAVSIDRARVQAVFTGIRPVRAAADAGFVLEIGGVFFLRVISADN